MANKNWKWATKEEYDNVQEMNRQEAIEGDKFLEAYEAAIDKAASFLNREFPTTPKTTWKAALNNPDAVQWTDDHKKARFNAAQKWIGTQC